MTLVILLLLGAEGYIFQNTGVYEPLEKDHVAVLEDGSVFVADSDEGHILRYGPDGERRSNIGRKGQGPGEFNIPSAITADGDKVYVVDYGVRIISVFALDGRFLSRFDFPGRGLNMIRAKGGWAVGDWHRGGETMTLRFAPDGFKTYQELAEWPKPVMQLGVNVKFSGSERPKAPYSPIVDTPRMVTDVQGAKIFLQHPGQFKISVIDLLEKDILKNFSRKLPVIPFNEAWGMAQFAKFKEENPQMVERVDFHPEFPKHFPAVRQMYLSASGQLVIVKWTGNPDGPPSAMVLNQDGGDGKLPYAPEHEARILAVRGDMAYLSLFDDPDGDAAILRTPLSNVDRAVKEHPIAFDGSGNRYIMTSR